MPSMCNMAARILLPSAFVTLADASDWESEAVSHLQLRPASNRSLQELNDRIFAARDKSLCNIFTLWDYSHDPELGHLLVVEGWRRHSAGLCNEPVLIDDANVMQYIPDMPDEYFKLPYEQAKSDMIRYGALHHHGGIYMDTDILVQKDLEPVIEKMKQHELVSYTQRRNVNSTCQNQFSSNFLAAPKGSGVMKAIWEAQKAAVQDHCPLSMATSEARLCCFDEDHECHIPWARLGEGTSHKVTLEMGLDERTYCFSDNDSFTPDRIADVLLENLELSDALMAMDKDGDKKPLDRLAYHLFNSNSGMSHMTCKELNDKNSLVGTLQRASYATGRGQKSLPQDRSEETKAWLEKYPDFKPLSDAAFNGKIPCK